MPARPLLVIGNRNYSSWSLRPWLLMKVNDIPFDEVRIPLYQQNSKAAILSRSPSGKVPALIDGATTVWESLAICEYVAERWPTAHCWPADASQRACARSLAAEMHSGFMTLRNALPMNCRRAPAPPTDSPADDALDEQIARIDEIFASCRRTANDGDFLFGMFGIVDAMYAPVVLRLNTYQVPVSTVSRTYMQTVLALPALKAWLAAARREEEVLERFER
jgi:glutathione S-transferase